MAAGIERLRDDDVDPCVDAASSLVGAANREHDAGTRCVSIVDLHGEFELKEVAQGRAQRRRSSHAGNIDHCRGGRISDPLSADNDGSRLATSLVPVVALQYEGQC